MEKKKNLLGSDFDDTEENSKILRKKSWKERYFSQMNEGSLRGSVFALSSIAIGTGGFALPTRAVQIGLINQILLLIFGGVCAYYSLTCMINAAKNIEDKDYSRIVKKSLGKVPAKILDFVLIIYLFGVLISYQVVIYSLIGRVYYELFKKNNYENFELFQNDIWNTSIYKFPIMFIISIILIPLCLLKDLSKMRFTSMTGIIAILYATFVILIQCPFFYNHYLKNDYKENIPSTHPNFFNPAPSLKSDLLIFQCFAGVFFCFTCHVGAYPIYKSLKNSTERRIKKVYKISIILDFFLYAIITISGFLTAPLNQPDLIIYRENNGVLSNDIFMILAKFAISISLIMSIAPNYNSFRISFIEFFFQTNEINDSFNYGVTIPTLLFSTFLGAVFNDILQYINLLGGFLSVIIQFLMPILIYIRNNEYELTHWKNLFSLIFVICLCSIGWTAGMETVIGLFK